MSEIKSINYIKFIIGTIFFGLVLLTSGTIYSMFNMDPSFDIVIKAVIVVAILFYAYKREDINRIFHINFSPVYLLVIIIPMVLSYILQNCPLDFEPYTSSIVLTVAGTLVTAVWEELYFRYVGCSLFEENGKYKWYNVIFLAVMFMGIHLINVYFNGWEATQNQLMFTFSLGIFLLALYIQTKSILVPIIGHFCVNSVADYFSLYATSSSPLYIGNMLQPFYIFYAIVLIAIGVIILKRSGRVF
jgi:hypothetical protein